MIDLAYSDDDLPPIISFFDDPPPAMSKPAIAGTSRKRPRSATIPDENAGVKKLKVKNEDNALGIPKTTVGFPLAAGPSSRSILGSTTSTNIAPVPAPPVVDMKTVFGAVPKVGTSPWN